MLIALFLATLANAGARSKFFNFFNVGTSVATEYGSKDSDEQEYLFSYIPDGYSQRFYEQKDDAIRVFWVNVDNKKDYILLSIAENNRVLKADTEDAQHISSITINRNIGELSLKDDTFTLAWTDSATATTFLLQSTISESDIIKFAEGISKK